MHVSTRRLLSLAFIIILFSLAVRQTEYFDPDFWWHLRTGQYIVDTRTIPHKDIYSFTRPDNEWITHEWLAEAAMYEVYRFGGWGWLVLCFSGMISAALWITYRRCESDRLTAALATLAGYVAAFPVLGVRPQMVSFLLASVYLSVLGSYLRLGTARLWALPVLMVVWVNAHGAFPLGLALIAIAAVGLAADELLLGQSWKRVWERVRPLCLTLAACALAIPLNPNGLRLYSYPFETLASAPMQRYIQEWASPDFHQLGFQPLAVLMLGAFALLVFSPKRARASEVLFLAVFSYGALRSGRHVPFFVLVAIPLLARHAGAVIGSLRGKRLVPRGGAVLSRPRAIMHAALAVMLMGAVIKQSAAAVAFRPSEEAQKLPAAAVQFMRTERPAGPIYNSFNWGGYLVWNLPEYSVFVDGRPDMYGDQFFDEAIRAYHGVEGWDRTLDRYGVRTVLIEPDGTLASLLRKEAGWTIIFEDRQAVIFARR